MFGAKWLAWAADRLGFKVGVRAGSGQGPRTARRLLLDFRVFQTTAREDVTEQLSSDSSHSGFVAAEPYPARYAIQVSAARG